MTDGFWPLVWGGLGAAITALGAWWLKYLPIKSAVSIAEEKDRAERESAEKSTAISNYRDFITLQHTEIAELRKKSDELAKSETECMVRCARLQVQVEWLEKSIHRIENATGQNAAAPPVIIIAGIDGLIRSVSPSVGPFLHYEPKELTRKPIHILMPDRYKAMHDAAMKRLSDTTYRPDPDRPIFGHAIDSNGREIPCVIFLHSWVTDKGDTLIAAEIRGRSPQLLERRDSFVN